MAVPTQLSDLSATAASNSPAGTDTVGTTMDDFIRAHASIIARISAGTDALATPALGNATGTSLVLSGALTAQGAFTSLGIDDNATANALTLSGSGANSVTIGNSATNPTIGTSSGNLALSTSAQVQNVASAVNYINLAGSIVGQAVAFVQARGSDTNVALTLTSQGTGSIGLATVNGTVPQVSVTHTASADRYITLTGSNGGNPTIGTSAGNLGISSSVVLTDGFIYGWGAAPTAWVAGTSASNVIGLYTNSVEQVRILNVVGATKRLGLYGGAAGNAGVNVSSGSLELGSPVVLVSQTVDTTVGAAGGASALPATPLGYLTTSINGTACKVPYYPV